MLQRLLLVLVLLLLLTLAMQGCGPSWYLSMQLEQAGGKPYLLLEHRVSAPDGGEAGFSIYRAKGDDWDAWEPVVTSRLGRAYGFFAARTRPEPLPGEAPGPGQGEGLAPEAGAETGAERLVVLHEKRATLYDVSGKEVTHSFVLLPFSWIAETAVPYRGAILVFGADMPPYEGGPREGVLRAARFDGQGWEELQALGPKVAEGSRGFSLQAVAIQDEIRVLWRGASPDQALSPNIEGPRATTEGPLLMATFKDDGFVRDSLTPVYNLPRGNTDAWAEGEHIKVLVQRRDKREDAFSSNNPMEIWQVGADGKAELVESIEKSRARSGLVAFIAAEHLTWQGQEFIVRSNWQMFEIWRQAPDGAFARVTSAPRGLPVFDLEGLLLAALGAALALIAFGAGLAYHRRRQAWTILRKVQASDLYASLGLRMGAYAVDLALILSGALFLGRTLGREYVSPVRMLQPDFSGLPHWPFFGLYLGYLAGGEWLLGTTLGKYIMGLSVVSDSGGRPSFWGVLVRNFVGFYERLPFTAFVAVLMIVFGPRRQRLGDLLARTFVVQTSALEVFKAQRVEAQARGRAVPDERAAELLPPLETRLWGLAGDDEKKKKKKDSESSDKNDRSDR